MKSLGIIVPIMVLFFFSSSMTSKNITTRDAYTCIPIDSPILEEPGPNRIELNKTIERIDKTIGQGKNVMKQIAKTRPQPGRTQEPDTVVKVVTIPVIDCPDTISYRPKFFERIKNIFKHKKGK